ncbi:MAG: AAA family ATPase [Gemmatimonadetes bacterium]|nr:AAA family ATPase [Gemmatimonadota bacterium]
MRLSRLELAGFKSFATSTTVEFHDGMTALVGPNGCGKSNVVEAIRWVLGEQKPTHIRGRKMQEVIFHGSRNRRPAARAQVAVTIDNSDGILPVAHSEVEIGRSIDREGKTRYTINRAVCRLRDVVDLCRDTGLGVGSYSAIEGRMLNAIISARGDERRALFEEAAGIGRYKDRRAVTERRLDAVAADLQRLDDLGVEIRKNVRRLSREKGRAERYLKQRSRLRALDVTLAERRLDDLRDQLAKVAAAGRDAAGDDGPDAVSFVRAEADHLALRKEVDLCRDARAKVVERRGEAASGLARCERELAVADERSVQAEARISRNEELRNAELARQKELDDELAVTRTGIEGVEADLRLVRRRTGTAANQAEELRAGMAAARRSVETLAAALRENARLSAGLGGEIEAGEERLLAGRQRLDALVRERSESLRGRPGG